jgi:hypothetical protein
MSDKIFYTYAYLREDGTPYYVGKGTGKRIYSTVKTVNLPKDKSRIIYLKKNLTEEEAFNHEIYMIAVFGRKDLGTGILHNKTNGGEGTSGRSNESLKKQSESMRKAHVNMTPGQLSESMRKAHAKKTPEQRSELIKKMLASITPERRSEIAKKRSTSITPERRSEIAKKQSEAARKMQANRTPEQRSESAKKGSSQRWQCTETGFITSPGNLSRYQKARCIDTSKRVKLS